jgi:hypothetical protein
VSECPPAERLAVVCETMVDTRGKAETAHCFPRGMAGAPFMPYQPRGDARKQQQAEQGQEDRRPHPETSDFAKLILSAQFSGNELLRKQRFWYTGPGPVPRSRGKR